MDWLYKIFLILFTAGTPFLAQIHRITKVIDSNLFMLEDSTLVKMAGIDMPRLDNPDYMLRITAEYAAVYAKKKLLNRPFYFKVIKAGEVKLVFIIKESGSSGEEILNLWFLKQGFGKFLNNIDTAFHNSFISAGQFALDYNKGLWKILNGREPGLLDLKNNRTSWINGEIMDSLDYLKMTLPEPGFIQVINEMTWGPLIGVVMGVPAGFMSLFFVSAEDEWSGIRATTLGWYSGYVLGSALSIYGYSRNTTKDVSIWGSMLSGAAGAALGLAIYQWNYYSNNRERNAWVYFAPLAFPIISSVLYANSIAPDRFPVRQSDDQRRDGFTAADIYNRAKVFELNLFRISF